MQSCPRVTHDTGMGVWRGERQASSCGRTIRLLKKNSSHSATRGTPVLAIRRKVRARCWCVTRLRRTINHLDQNNSGSSVHLYYHGVVLISVSRFLRFSFIPGGVNYTSGSRLVFLVRANGSVISQSKYLIDTCLPATALDLFITTSRPCIG